MNVYLIKEKITGRVIKWEGTLKSFLEMIETERCSQGWYIEEQEITDGMRRTLANTRQRETYYKGYRVLFFGDEKPKQDEDPNIYEWVEEPQTILEEKTKEIVNVLFLPDVHCPNDYVKGIEIAKRIYEEEGCTEVVFLGDIVDFYSISEYGKSPDFISQKEELVKTKEHLKAWHDAFPVAKVCTGNHTMRIKRKFDKAGLSTIWMNDFRNVFGLQGWDFKLYHEIGKFIATHGMGQNVKSRSKDLKKSVISGHLHSKFEANYNDGLWAIYGGCMVDINNMAFEYGKFFKLPKLGFVVIKDIENIPVIKMIPIKYVSNCNCEKMSEMW